MSNPRCIQNWEGVFRGWGNKGGGYLLSLFKIITLFIPQGMRNKLWALFTQFTHGRDWQKQKKLKEVSSSCYFSYKFPQSMNILNIGMRCWALWCYFSFPTSYHLINKHATSEEFHTFVCGQILRMQKQLTFNMMTPISLRITI